MAFLDEVIEECNAKIDLEGRIIASLEELNKERKNNKETTKHLKESNELVVTLKVEIEELKRMVEQLEKENQMKQNDCNNLEGEVVALRIQLEENQQKFKTYHKFEGSSKRLDEILENQIPSKVKHGIGF